MRPARPHCGQEEGNQGFPLLVNQPLSFRARCARKGKSRFPSAARLSGQGKQNGCHPRNRAPGSSRPTRWGGNCHSCCFSAVGRRKVWRHAPCARSAPLFAAANAVTLWAHTYAPAPTHRKWGDSQEGRNFVSPLLCACRAQRHRLPGRALRAPTVMRIYFVPRRAVAHLPPSRHRLQGKVVFLW